MLRLAVVSPAVFRFTACPVLSACGLGTTPSTRSTLAGATSHLPKCYQLTHKAFDLKGLQEARCGSADDAEVVPPEDDGSADDAEVVPPDAEVATGFTPGRIARTDRTQGHNRGINPLATWKCGRRGGRPSR